MIIIITAIEPTFRFFYRCGYGDASLSIYENMVHMSSINESRADFYGKMIERTNNKPHSIFQVDSSNFRELLPTSKVHEPNENFLSFCGHESSREDLLTQPIAQDFMQNDTLPANQVELKILKRKASNLDLDLDLSLRLNSRNIIGDHDHQKQGSIENHHDEVHSSLSLSLYTQSSYDESQEQEKRVNVGLDLTI